jgi:hypothetical protein
VFHFKEFCVSFLIGVEVFLCYSFSQEKPKYTEDDVFMELDTSEIITARGYPVETHFAHTEDGFVLGLHRIPSKTNHFNDTIIEDDDETHHRTPLHANYEMLDGATFLEGKEKKQQRQENKRKGVVLIVHGFMQSSEAFVARKDTHDSIAFALADAG